MTAQTLQAAIDVLAERSRQVSVEGWTPEHDDEHRDGAMSKAAASYALFGDMPMFYEQGHPPPMWPWHASWWKPSEDHRRNLIKAGALILAEIERMDRAYGIEPANPPTGEDKPHCRDCADFGPICPNDGKPCSITGSAI